MRSLPNAGGAIATCARRSRNKEGTFEEIPSFFWLFS
jgi:hypothetical protein